MTLIEQLRVLSCSDKLTQSELDTVMAAIRAIEGHKRAISSMEMAATQDARDAATERRWMDRNEADGVPYGTY